MSHPNPTLAEDTLPGESYSTFWTPIPVEAATPIDARERDDAYAAFLDHAEVGPMGSLTVEQADVG